MEDNIVYGNMIINPTKELTPSITIAPFSTDPTPSYNDEIDIKTIIPTTLTNITIVDKGRNALLITLKELNLSSNDYVTILTPSNNLYVSSCVTKQIDKVCKWNRVINDRTKAILVIHEFGYRYTDIIRIQSLGLPIIEDCAYSFFTDTVGMYGDYAIYSLPKALPMQAGGIIASKHQINYHCETSLEEYVKNKLRYWHPLIKEIAATRLNNYYYLTTKLAELNIKPYFRKRKGEIPSVFLFKWHPYVNYEVLKSFLQQNGVECSVFYGTNAFFIPCHQNLKRSDLDYMIDLIMYFSNNLI